MQPFFSDRVSIIKIAQSLFLISLKPLFYTRIAIFYLRYFPSPSLFFLFPHRHECTTRGVLEKLCSTTSVTTPKWVWELRLGCPSLHRIVRVEKKVLLKFNARHTRHCDGSNFRLSCAAARKLFAPEIILDRPNGSLIWAKHEKIHFTLLRMPF